MIHNENRKGDFLQIISVNEKIKTLEDYSYLVRIKALNAYIMAAQKGSSARGYNVVAHEIIRFSQKLEIACHTLIGLCKEMVHKSSIIAKKDRELKTIQKTIRCSQNRENNTKSEEHLSEIYHRLQMDSQHFAAENLSLKNESGQTTQKILRLCLDGKMMAFQSKVETAYIKGSTQAFWDVSNNFEDSMITINGLIGQINITISQEKQ